jgi:hypothetical protein
MINSSGLNEKSINVMRIFRGSPSPIAKSDAELIHFGFKLLK